MAETRVASKSDATREASYLTGSLVGTSGQASYRLPTRETCELAVAMVGAVPSVSDPAPGGVVRRFGLTVTPGSVRLGTSLRGHELVSHDWALDYVSEPDAPTPGRTREERHRITAQTIQGVRTGAKSEVVEWSRKSRLNMARVLASLDWAAHIGSAAAGWRPMMLTLTLPREWEGITPDGASLKRLMSMFWKRWRRYFGEEWAGCWKLEFQGRGAPHVHLYGNAPTGKAFERWLSATWSAVVWGTLELEDLAGPMLDGRPRSAHALDHWRAGTGVDWRQGVRATDPKRIALYFLGRSVGHNLGVSKEYQHRVPELWKRDGHGPGRFWGHRGLERVAVSVEIDDVMFVQLRRLVRRWARATGRRIPSASWSRYQGYTLLHPDAPALLTAAFRWDALDPGELVAAGVDVETGERLRLVGPRGYLP